MRYSFANAALVTLAIISLAAAAPDKPQKITVSISDMAFAPAAQTVNIGDTVTWVNDDDRDHSVVAADGSFKSGNIKPGARYAYTFKKAGKFAYGCSYHPRMKGSITVKG